MTFKVKAEGTLYHQFHGTYNALVGLVFQDAASAKDALTALGKPWKQSTKDPKVLTFSGGNEALDAFKARFADWGGEIIPCGWPRCSHQCKGAEIDNVNHSVDRGANFVVEIPITPAEQLGLLG